jgi:hypothetical protein
MVFEASHSFLDISTLSKALLCPFPSSFSSLSSFLFCLLSYTRSLTTNCTWSAPAFTQIPGTMPQAYKPVALEEHSPTSHDGACEDEKLDWTSEKRTISNRLQNLAVPHWTWMIQAVMLSASVTFFAVGLCMRTGKRADAIPTTWCRCLTYLNTRKIRN